jgi:uncharacterized LabA/DUF88 family protein
MSVAILPLGKDDSQLESTPDSKLGKSSRNTQCRVALMIDWENLEIPRCKGELNISQRNLVRQLSEYASGIGNISVATAVAGFTERDGRAMWMLNVNGIVPKVTMTRACNGKIQSNAADIHLCVEILQVLMCNPMIDHFILASGDGGFLPLVRLLRKHGKTVSVLGAMDDHISQHLKREADQWTSVEALIRDEEE